MRIIIDIPEDLYDMICTPNTSVSLARRVGFICAAIEDGTPLPKGHGRLKDVDAIKEYARVVVDEYLGRLHTVDVEHIDNAPTIIEADKENDAYEISN